MRWIQQAITKRFTASAAAGLFGVVGWLICLTANAADNSATIAAIIHDYDAFARIQDPLRAATRGDRSAMLRWPDNSPAAVTSRKTQLLTFRDRLESTSAATASAKDALNLALISDRVDVALEGLAFDEERMPFTSGDGFYTAVDYAALNTVLKDAADAEAWIARLRAIPAYYASETSNMERGVKTGFTQPAMTVRRAIADVRAQAEQAPDASPLLKPFATLPATLPAARREQLSAAAQAVVADAIKPAQRALLEFFEHDYLPAARADIAASSLPDGRAWYRYQVRRHTTTQMTPEEIHALGQREVARIRTAMDHAMKETGFKGSFAEFLQFLRTDKRFYVSAERYGEKASEVAKRADALLPRFFGTLPRLTYGVQAMPAGLESSPAGYLPGSPASGVAGLVVYKPWMASKMPVFGIAAWVLHEGVPGHHLQIARGQELIGIPDFRRNDDVSAFVEGWGLYAEKLGEDMHIYRDPHERFGRLSLEMWRACRLLIDTGIHWMGWSRGQGMECLQKNSALAQTEIDFEVDRYIAWPGQALAYKVGEQKIIELRGRAERALGERFDIRRFHDLVLGAGPMPLALLEQRVDRWIAAGGIDRAV